MHGQKNIKELWMLWGATNSTPFALLPMAGRRRNMSPQDRNEPLVGIGQSAKFSILHENLTHVSVQAKWEGSALCGWDIPAPHTWNRRYSHLSQRHCWQLGGTTVPQSRARGALTREASTRPVSINLCPVKTLQLVIYDLCATSSMAEYVTAWQDSSYNDTFLWDCELQW